jgi:hypothetical protein
MRDADQSARDKWWIEAIEGKHKEELEHDQYMAITIQEWQSIKKSLRRK